MSNVSAPVVQLIHQAQNMGWVLLPAWASLPRGGRQIYILSREFHLLDHIASTVELPCAKDIHDGIYAWISKVDHGSHRSKRPSHPVNRHSPPRSNFNTPNLDLSSSDRGALAKPIWLFWCVDVPIVASPSSPDWGTLPILLPMQYWHRRLGFLRHWVSSRPTNRYCKR